MWSSLEADWIFSVWSPTSFSALSPSESTYNDYISKFRTVWLPGMFHPWAILIRNQVDWREWSRYLIPRLPLCKIDLSKLHLSAKSPSSFQAALSVQPLFQGFSSFSLSSPFGSGGNTCPIPRGFPTSCLHDCKWTFLPIYFVP